MPISFGPLIESNNLSLLLDSANKKSYNNVGIASTVWKNIIKTEESGAIEGSFQYSDIDSGVLIFNENNSFVKIPHSDWQNSNFFSISLWINPNVIYDAESILFGKGGNSGYYLSLSTSGNLNFYDRGETNSVSTSNNPISILQWYNIVATASTISGLQLYINGSLVASNSNPFGGNTTSGDFYIASKESLGVLEKSFNGSFPYFSFYSKILTQSEIIKNYNEIKVRFIPTDSNTLQEISGDILLSEDDILLTENDEILIL